MLVSDLMHDREAEAGAPSPAGEEWLEDVREVLAPESRAGIRHRALDPHTPVGLKLLAGQKDFIVRLGVLDGILQQVAEDSDQAIAVQPNGR
jgi:hypothetical protein